MNNRQGTGGGEGQSRKTAAPKLALFFSRSSVGSLQPASSPRCCFVPFLLFQSSLLGSFITVSLLRALGWPKGGLKDGGGGVQVSLLSLPVPRKFSY